MTIQKKKPVLPINTGYPALLFSTRLVNQTAFGHRLCSHIYGETSVYFVYPCYYAFLVSANPKNIIMIIILIMMMRMIIIMQLKLFSCLQISIPLKTVYF